jgi:hypothetical protein
LAESNQWLMKQKGEILHTLLQKYLDCIVFLHNTREKEVADRINHEGFIFENQLAHSTDRVNPVEQIETTYFLFQRKDYGPFTIVIAFPKKTYSLYTRHSNQFEIPVEELISKVRPRMGENDELIYIVPPQHIAGYFDNTNGEFIPNPLFNTSYISYRDREDF